MKTYFCYEHAWMSEVKKCPFCEINNLTVKLIEEKEETIRVKERLLEEKKKNLQLKEQIDKDHGKVEPKKCLVEGCQNQSDQGTFIGDLCMSCHKTISLGWIRHGKTFIHDLKRKHDEYRDCLANMGFKFCEVCETLAVYECEHKSGRTTYRCEEHSGITKTTTGNQRPITR
ncbi:MAG TPA: hypothetical protein VK982_08445 [Bacteroidales bacterium]|nr:hypothetical protein [Bacteroidales bacterium]